MSESPMSEESADPRTWPNTWEPWVLEDGIWFRCQNVNGASDVGAWVERRAGEWVFSANCWTLGRDGQTALVAGGTASTLEMAKATVDAVLRLSINAEEPADGWQIVRHGQETP